MFDQMRRIALLFLPLIMVLTGVSLAAEPLLIKPDFKGEFIGSHVLHLEDKSRQLTLDQVKSPEVKSKFAGENQKNLNFGSSDSAHWLYFSARNEGARDMPWFLQMEFTMLSRVEVYEETAAGAYRLHEGGDQIPFDRRDVKHRKNVFSMTATPGTSGVFIRILPVSKGPNNFSMTAWNEKGFVEKNNVENLVLGLFYGALLALLSYNLFIYLSVGDISYRWYILYLAGAIMSYFGVNGLGFEYLWGNSAYAARSLPFAFYTLAYAFIFLFARSFLETAKNLPGLDKVLTAGAVISGVFTAVTLADVNSNSNFNGTFAFPATMFFPPLLFYSGLRSLWKGVRQARFYVAAWLVFLLGITLYSFMDLGLLPESFITTYSVQVGTLVEVLLLSLALADRMKIMREEKENAEAETRAVLQKGKDELEAKVAERTKELLNAKEKAENATLLKDQFVTLVSHDLKTPILSIRGAIDLVTNGVIRQEERINDLLGQAAHSADGLLRMIDQLLEHNSLKAGKNRTEKRFHSASRLTGEQIQRVGLAAQNKGITLANDLPPDMLIFVDGGLFGQALTNLLSNAVKFTPKGGSVTLFAPQPGKPVIAVRDTGIGLPPEILGSLFQGDTHSTTVGTAGEKGFGLGLSYAQAIVRTHGGSLTAESQPGKGSTFTINLPEHRAVVMVVDDLPLHRKRIKALLANLDSVEVIEAGNGHEAWENLTPVAPDLVITDIQMPEMDGYAFLVKMRMEEAFRPIPVIVLSAQTDLRGEGSARDKAILAGADEFLSKTASDSAILEAIRKYIRPRPS